MRILHLLNECEDAGNGIVNCAVDLAAAQAEFGHVVAVASGGGQFESLLARFEVAHHTIDQKGRPLTALRAIPPLVKLLDTFKPDIVHCHMMTGILLARLLRHGRPYQIVSHVHNIYQRTSVLMGLADRVIAVNTKSRQLLIDRRIRPDKIRVVLNGIIGGARRRQWARPIPKDLHHPAVVTVAGMYFRKGIAELIDAFDAVSGEIQQASIDPFSGGPEGRAERGIVPSRPALRVAAKRGDGLSPTPAVVPHLYLVGDGPDQAALERHATSKASAGRIHFTGFDPAPQSYMAAADLFVLASRRESFPLVVLEAREMGCPIVCTDVDGCAEALDDGHAGKLVPGGNAPALAAALRECLTDESLRDRLRQAAVTRIDRITVRRMAGQVMDVYREALALKATHPAPGGRMA